MDDISTLDEARNVLTQDALSMTDVRDVLLFLVEQNAEVRAAANRTHSALLSALEILTPVIKGFAYIPIQDLELRNQLIAAKELIRDIISSIEADSVVH